jgi:hypothetical protein
VRAGAFCLVVAGAGLLAGFVWLTVDGIQKFRADA